MTGTAGLQGFLEQVWQATEATGQAIVSRAGLELQGSQLALADVLLGALGVTAPPGDPSAVAQQGAVYTETAAKCAAVQSDLHHVAANQLPAAWTGEVADTAAQAVAALGTEATTAITALRAAGQALAAWSATLGAAQAQFSRGVAQLDQVLEQCAGSAFLALLQPAAAAAINEMIHACQSAEEGESTAYGVLDQYAAQARAGRVGGGDLTDLDEVVLAAQTGPGGGADGGDILSAEELTRGSTQLSGMDAADQAAFEKLLQQAESPAQSAYLWKALAAGYPMAQVQSFDALIQPHGADAAWLSEHLTPAINTQGSGPSGTGNSDLTYQGQDIYLQGYPIYSQRNVNDCVAASTALAQLSMDPVLMLKMTTGDTPSVKGVDRPQGFESRLQGLYTSYYVQGQHMDGDSSVYPKNDGGLGDSGIQGLADGHLGSEIGSSYTQRNLNSSADRQAAIEPIIQAVDQGKPVPVDVGPASGMDHQMMIIAHSGNELEIYNPWGWSGWVTEQQFVNNQIGGLTNGECTTAYQVHIPQ
jgi:hypothetical protein